MERVTVHILLCVELATAPAAAKHLTACFVISTQKNVATATLANARCVKKLRSVIPLSLEDTQERNASQLRNNPFFSLNLKFSHGLLFLLQLLSREDFISCLV